VIRTSLYLVFKEQALLMAHKLPCAPNFAVSLRSARPQQEPFQKSLFSGSASVAPLSRLRIRAETEPLVLPALLTVCERRLLLTTTIRLYFQIRRFFYFFFDQPSGLRTPLFQALRFAPLSITPTPDYFLHPKIFFSRPTPKAQTP
jgi:hypothetical protein